MWRLSVTGPEDPGASDQESGSKGPPARNYFMVRTIGDVDLYLKPEPGARVRGVRLEEPRFGGAATHDFTVQTTAAGRLRFVLLRPSGDNVDSLHCTLPAGAALERRVSLEHDDRLKSGLMLETVAYVPAVGQHLPGLVPLRVSGVSAEYGLGIEQEARLFCNLRPLTPMPVWVPVRIQDARGHGVAARLMVTSPQTANEVTATYADATGTALLDLLPGVNYRATVTRGYEFEPQIVSLTATARLVHVTMQRRFTPPPGWYSGDDHCHTVFYDGTHTPVQMVEAARAAGLDWVTVSEHGHSERIERVEQVNAETAPLSEPGRFVVLPGMEYTGPTYHANIIGGVVRVPANAPLQDVVDAGLAADRADAPVLVQLNHPTIGKTAADAGRQTQRLPLVELWNSPEPAATELWWEMLNAGRHIVATTNSDSHQRVNLEPGSRRTYITLGQQPLTPVNILRALRVGHSCLSRGGLIDLKLNGQGPGDTVKSSASGPTLDVHLESWSASPLVHIDLISGTTATGGDGMARVAARLQARGQSHFTTQLRLPVHDGWYLAQAFTAGDPIPVAMTNPIWVGP